MRKHQIVSHYFTQSLTLQGQGLALSWLLMPFQFPWALILALWAGCVHTSLFVIHEQLLGRHHQFSFQLSTPSWVLGSHLSPREWACLSAHPPEELLRALPGRWGDPRPGLCRTYWQVTALWTHRVSMSLSVLLLVFPTSALQASCTPPPTCQDLVAPLTFHEYALLLSSSVKSRSDPRPGCS